MLENGYWHEAPGGWEFPTSLGSHAAERASKISSESTGSDICANNGHRLVGEKVGVDGNSSLGQVPRAENDLGFLDDPYDDGKHSSDLFLDYGWPDELGNFDDVDRMFRSCDSSTFGLGTSYGDESLGWFSSLDAIEEGCGEGTRPDFNLSSCLSPTALKMISVAEDAINYSGVTDQSSGGDCYGGNLWDPENSRVPPPTLRPSYQVGPTFPDERRVEKKKKKQIDMDGVSMKAPMELDCSSGVNENASEEANSFRQLQHVMETIDLKTKLCIRDSLYRLARSAEQRNRHPNLNGDASGDLIANTKRCVGYVDMEADTNPVDRSIAHLLFHQR
ncbi:unnamed protein product [Cuscuta campestris]|uniref:Protein LNK1 n=1 Tax=Cuscuta campestris TaxID=132261 RepID=A0A484LNZ1_9ASTE|nr:unnamed protein product [Cuscuta campestris]